MGFGTELQQKNSHEALLRLQDAEIRLLENIRRCFTLRIKSDKDYASALNAVCSCAQRFENSEFSSPIFDGTTFRPAWNLIVRETQNLSNVLKTRAETLSVNPMEKLALLISEKKLARKLYYDERNRLDFEIYRLHEEVNRNRTEYERMMDKLKADRMKYEEMRTRGKGGNKLDEAKSRYLKTTSKLHKLHNDYVLSIRDFSIQQKNMHSVILPNLLDYHHKIQESLVKQCKDVLEEYVRLTDLSYVDIISAHKNMAEVLGSIQPATEYDKFLDDYRSDPLKEEVMEFDGELLEDYQGNLRPDAIAFNDLTVSHLNQSRTAYETKISSCKTRIESKEKDLASVESEIAQLPHTNDLSDEQKASLLVKQRQALILKREISELVCHMQKYEQLLSIVKTAIESSGDHDPPAGLTFEVIQNERRNSRNDIQETQSMNEGASSTTFKRKFPNIKNPFTKRSTSAPPKPPSRDEIEKRESLRYENHDDEDDPGPISSKEANPCRKIEDEEWFHGVLPREEVQRLLTNDGDFLVRESRNRTSGEPQSVLSVMWKGHKHFIIQGGESNWRFEGPSFPTIQDLIDHQVQSETSVTGRSGAILKNMIVRKDWQLKNDDIDLGPRIGKGNFGDVFRGKYRNQEVAVKTCREVLDESVKKKFLKEGQILRQYNHQNIVRFIGIAAQRQPIMIVMEYVPGGSLLNFLKEKGCKQSQAQLVAMCVDAAAGMSYLESRNCIHRDLAARNCLVGDDNIVKIADFGMSREEEVYIISEGCKQIPIKWTAPEALELAQYTSKCDVWSFGVLMWEVFAGGETPYKGMNNNQAKSQIMEGYRMPAPSDTPEAIYQLMLRCWHKTDQERPNFDTVHGELEQIHGRL